MKVSVGPGHTVVGNVTSVGLVICKLSGHCIEPTDSLRGGDGGSL